MDNVLKIAAIVLGTALALPTNVIAAPDGSDLKDLVQWMTGTFSTSVQASEEPEHLSLDLHMNPIWLDTQEGRWLYVEQALSEYPGRPYRQRVYQVREPEPELFEIRVFALPDPPATIGAWRDEAPLADLEPGDLEIREGCEILLRRRGESFIGSTLASLCLSTLRGAAFATSEVLITPNGLVSRDRGFDEAGRQVWGPTTGRYVFDRIVEDPDIALEPEPATVPDPDPDPDLRTMITVKSLHIYPVKSCRGIPLESADVISTGFRWDRQWMVVDREGSFLSQRSHPAMATVAARIEGDRLVLSSPHRPDLSIDLAEPSRDSKPVRIWKDTCRAIGEGPAAADWFSRLLGTRCELVRQADRRQVDPGFAEPDDVVSFADGFPFLLISDSSVNELNRRLDTPVPAARFRANIVVGGCPPHGEDSWRSIEIASVAFRIAKPCARCVVVNTDQSDGFRTTEPITTLSGYRTTAGKVLFGQNLVHHNTGTIAVGDTVTITGVAPS